MKPRSPLTIRTLIAEGSIALAVCAGAYLILVDPAEAERRALAQQGTAPPAATAQAPDADAAALVKSLTDIRAFALRINQNSALSLDESTIVNRYMKEAARCGVRIESVQPSTTRGRGPTSASKAATSQPVDRFADFDLRVAGEYAAVTAFIARIQDFGGYTVVSSVRIAPDRAPGSTTVQASIDVGHLAMDTRALASVMPKAETPR